VCQRSHSASAAATSKHLVAETGDVVTTAAQLRCSRTPTSTDVAAGGTAAAAAAAAAAACSPTPSCRPRRHPAAQQTRADAAPAWYRPHLDAAYLAGTAGGGTALSPRELIAAAAAGVPVPVQFTHPHLPLLAPPPWAVATTASVIYSSSFHRLSPNAILLPGRVVKTFIGIIVIIIIIINFNFRQRGPQNKTDRQTDRTMTEKMLKTYRNKKTQTEN